MAQTQEIKSEAKKKKKKKGGGKTRNELRQITAEKKGKINVMTGQSVKRNREIRFQKGAPKLFFIQLGPGPPWTQGNRAT